MSHAPHPRPAVDDPSALTLADAVDRKPEANRPKRTLPPGIEPLLGIDDLAAILRCSRRLVERMRSAGKVPKPDLQVGKCPRWTPATIRRWIEGGGNGR